MSVTAEVLVRPVGVYHWQIAPSLAVGVVGVGVPPSGWVGVWMPSAAAGPSNLSSWRQGCLATDECATGRGGIL